MEKLIRRQMRVDGGIEDQFSLPLASMFLDTRRDSDTKSNS